MKSPPLLSIVIASVLKPIKDVRGYQKIGQSLASSFAFAEIHIVGYNSQVADNQVDTKNIYFHPIFNFYRLHPKRILANLFFFRKLIALKPTILIVSTFELLPSAVLYKWFFGAKLIYDVQENYGANLLYTSVYPWGIRHLLAWGVKLMERLASFWVDEFWLAEECYAQELNFLRGKYLILPNKFQAPHTEQVEFKVQKQFKTFLMSGTISEAYGVWQAIDFITKMQSIDNQWLIKIVGHCPQKNLYEKLQKIAQEKPFIQLNISLLPLPYPEIIQAIQSADFALLPYQINRSYQNRIPTKFYEYLHYQMPMLVQQNPTWERFFKQFPTKTAILLNFNDLSDVEKIILSLNTNDFYHPSAIFAEIYWEKEALKMKSSIQKLLKLD
jgi:glycosyltransferase involved in cell wall biosynthesis